jgi:hypothetical protein
MIYCAHLRNCKCADMQLYPIISYVLSPVRATSRKATRGTKVREGLVAKRHLGIFFRKAKGLGKKLGRLRIAQILFSILKGSIRVFQMMQPC